MYLYDYFIKIWTCSTSAIQLKCPAGCNWKISPLDVTAVKQMTGDWDVYWFLTDAGWEKEEYQLVRLIILIIRSFNLILRWTFSSLMSN